METWKQVVGMDNYEVSNQGSIKSNDRQVRWSHHNKTGMSLRKGKILKGIPRIFNNNITYIQHGFSENGITKIHHAHRIVAKAFIPNPKNKPQVNHKDGNGQNNKVTNLEWVTRSENAIHARQVLGRKAWHKGNMGKNTPTAKKVNQHSLCGILIKEWTCASDAVRQIGAESSCITRCCKGQSLTHKGFKWSYG
jgi:hypothetical protein